MSDFVWFVKAEIIILRAKMIFKLSELLLNAGLWVVDRSNSLSLRGRVTLMKLWE